MEGTSRKRNHSDSDDESLKRSKPSCKYGEKCFRRNILHLKEFSHPHLDNILATQTDPNSLNLPHDSSLNQSVVKDQLRIMRDNNIATPQRAKKDPSPKKDEKIVEIFKNEKMQKKEVKVTSSDSKSLSSSSSNVDQSVASSSTAPSSTTNIVSGGRNSIVSPSVSCKRTAAKYDIHDFCPVVATKGLFAEKLAKAAPYNIFYTTVADAPLTHNDPLSITFQELLDTSLGNLKSSLQLNFMVDISWLMAQYYFAGYRNKPLTILYGADDEDLKTITMPTITAVKVKMLDAFGTHHTKVMIFEYEDNSLRVVVSTANLYEDDWHNRVQGLWVSPKCPPLQNSEGSNSDEGNGPTNFKKDLINYLNSYKLSALQEWIAKVRRTDFSHINVVLVVSVPGTHKGVDFDKYGHTRLGFLLSKHCTISTDKWSPNEWNILCQCSSIGSLGPNPNAWLCGQVRTSLSRMTQKMLLSMPPLSVVYPSFENVKSSHDHLLGGGCLPYNRESHQKQVWLENYLCQWKAASRNRNRAMPHIKTYCRVSPDLSQMAWFHLTSANLSKAAWGHIPVAGAEKRITIRSYEVGVLFLPKFVCDDTKFLLNNCLNQVESQERIFPFPYDLPLTPYSKTDGPFFMNYLRG